jgi:hypothetical protein
MELLVSAPHGAAFLVASAALPTVMYEVLPQPLMRWSGVWPGARVGRPFYLGQVGVCVVPPTARG